MGRNTSRHLGKWDDARSVEGASCSAWGTVSHRVVAEPPHCRLGEMVPFLVTRNAKSLVFLNFEFQRPTDGDAQAMPFENTEAQESACGIRDSNRGFLPAGDAGGGGGQESLAFCDQIKVELLSLTWFFGAYSLCGETYLLPSGLRQFLECGSELHPTQLCISGGILSKPV